MISSFVIIVALKYRGVAIIARENLKIHEGDV